MTLDVVNQSEAATPHYALLHRDQRLGPVLEQGDATESTTAIYSFSDKQPYDTFMNASELALVPYPIVKGYLRGQLAKPGNGLRLMVLDAQGPEAATLHAATIDAVLKAQEHGASHVTATHRLTLSDHSNEYRVEAIAD